MNRKTKTAYVCTECGQDYGKWRGKCDNCGLWDTVHEIRIPASPGETSRYGASAAAAKKAPAGARKLAECAMDQAPRMTSGIGEVDRVLGGGLVRGACILLGGDPGIGKSTLLLQLAARIGKTRRVLYLSGEESPEQVAMRAQRLQVGDAAMELLTETSVESILATLGEATPDLVIIDSIQTVYSEALQSAPGSVAQIRESAAMLLRFAKETGAVMIFIGHVTKDGSIAGPRLLEHMVDTVLYFEGDGSYQFRVLRTVKNRFGPSGELALLTMSDDGLHEIANASEFFLMNRHQPQAGTAVAPILEGTRIMMVELQALVNKSHFGMPQRVASGVNQRKLALLLAVLERHGGVVLGDFDVFFNIAGGLTVTEPAIDLGIAAALLSSFRNKPVRREIAFIGELGLGGEIRPVNAMSARFKELARMGFAECIVPRPSRNAEWMNDSYGITLTTCAKVGGVQELLF
ncbi:MAG: DNA repair protein RadA [Chitinispirillaceae bacterium]|nr:DNA repair protein RadA [Chitinispirillaceae bacterium]